MIKLTKILSEIKIQGLGYKRELISWFIDKSPWLFDSLMQKINGYSNEDINSILGNYDFEDNFEEMKQKSNTLISLLKPNEIWVHTINSEHPDDNFNLPTSYKFLKILEMPGSEGDILLILSNEKY